MAASAIQYASQGDAQIAYRISDGDGPILVAVSGTGPDIRIREHPMTMDFYERIEGFARLLFLDPRGTGRSDPVPPEGLTTEGAVHELLAVVDHAGLDRFDLWGFHAGGLTAIAFAATYPDRVDRLILSNTWARALRADDQPWGMTEAFSDALIEEHRRHIGDGQLFADAFVPSRRGDPHVAQWFADIESAISRAQSVELTRWAQTADVRSYLPRIVAPTLVLGSDRAVVPVEHSRHLAEVIPNATLVEIEGVDHMFVLSDLRDAFVDEIQRFLTGSLPRPQADRVFATVLFTDIVGSTERADAMGDASWRLTLEDHDRITGETVERYGGEIVKSTGDGVLAVFDAPSRAVRAAFDLAQRFEGTPTPVRAGLHAGEIERRGDDVAGIAVHLAQRVCSHADAGEVLVSRGLPDLVLGTGLVFTDRGEHRLKGLDEPMRLWSVS